MQYPVPTTAVIPRFSSEKIVFISPKLRLPVITLFSYISNTYAVHPNIIEPLDRMLASQRTNDFVINRKIKTGQKKHCVEANAAWLVIVHRKPQIDALCTIIEALFTV